MTVSGAWTGALLIVAWTLCAEALANIRAGWEVPASWLLAFALAVLAFERAGSASAMQVAGGLAAACGAFAIFGGVRGLNCSGAALPLGVGFYGLLANTHLFATDFPLAAAVLLGLAPLAAWIGELRLFSGRPAWMRMGARLLAVLVIGGIGLAIAASHAPDATLDDNPYGSYGSR